MTPSELVASVLATSDDQIAVTGATGWFGATALDLLYDALGPQAPERVRAYASRSRVLTVADGRTVDVRPLAELADQAPAPTILLHFAFLTRDKVAEVGLDAYVRRNVAISASVLDAVAAHRPRGVVVASSGAVYGAGPRLVADVDGDPYGALKRIDELAFAAACSEVGATCVVPRVFSVAGARMTKPEKYALGSLIGMARAGEPLRVRATLPVVRSYCGVDEVVALSLWAGAQGRPLVFDSGGAPVEVGELAGVVAAVHGRDDEPVRDWDPDATPDRYVGDPSAMTALADAAGLQLRSLPALVRETARWLSGGPQA
ncbi:NAD-dependent epimerase/dehydratase family protein [Cellulomonas soli]